MLINNTPLVDPSTVRPYYLARNLSTKLLDKCNSQEYRYIDGYGKGYFLSTNIFSSDPILTLGTRATTLKLLDRISLEHPNKTGTILYIYETAEPKYFLKDFIVSRNYNITIDKSLSLYGDTTIHTLPPDNPAITLEDIIEDILPVDYTLDYQADELYCFDVNIEGLSVLRAIDYLCSTYGLIWTSTSEGEEGSSTASGTSDTVTIWNPANLQYIQNPSTPNPIRDIRHSTLSVKVSDVNVSFSIYDYCRKGPKQYYTKAELSGGPGKTINVMDHFYPAVASSLDTIRNTALLDTRATVISTNLQEIADLVSYIEKPKYFTPSEPHSLSEMYGDWGDGPKTILRSIPYPYQMPLAPPSKDRYAHNWVGTLADGYYGPVGSFVVNPSIGLDGKLPPGPQPVANIYKWNYGEAGWNVRVEWDCTNARWIPLQQEYDCPPDEDPGPPETPTEPEEFPYPPPLPFPPD